jgi:hypothetical protein
MSPSREKRLQLQSHRVLSTSRTTAEIDDDLAFLAEATARIDNTPDDWLALWEMLQVSSDLRGANKEQWRLFNQYAKIAFINAV